MNAALSRLFRLVALRVGAGIVVSSALLAVPLLAQLAPAPAATPAENVLVGQAGGPQAPLIAPVLPVGKAGATIPLGTDAKGASGTPFKLNIGLEGTGERGRGKREHGEHEAGAGADHCFALPTSSVILMPKLSSTTTTSP